MRIAVDAMGGDYAPAEIVAGAVEAGTGLGDRLQSIILLGDETAIRRELDRCGKTPACITVRHASEVIGMDETPALAVRKKKDASISRAVDLVRNGEADVALSAGNTGAVVVAATLKLRLLEGIMRPAIATMMPTQDRPLLLIDAGATIDCTPEILRQFAIMGAVYSRHVMKQPNPVVGLMSIGSEETKGNEITKETFRLLQASGLNFRGNVEGHDLFRGETDVIVCDGFVGNIVLKTAESVAHAIGAWLKSALTKNMVNKMAALILRNDLRAMKTRMDPEMYGGAPLLGVNGVCIITHGASSRRAIFHAIRVSVDAVRNQVNQHIVDEIRKFNSKP